MDVLQRSHSRHSCCAPFCHAGTMRGGPAWHHSAQCRMRRCSNCNSLVWHGNVHYWLAARLSTPPPLPPPLWVQEQSELAAAQADLASRVDALPALLLAERSAGPASQRSSPGPAVPMLSLSQLSGAASGAHALGELPLADTELVGCCCSGGGRCACTVSLFP